MITVVDSSALAKLVVEEQESPVLRAHLRAQSQAGASFYASAAAVTELRRLAIRLDIAPASADGVLARFTTIRLSEGILQLASRMPQRHLGTLDAIHIATALTIEADAFLTYDERQAVAANEEGMVVWNPGA